MRNVIGPLAVLLVLSGIVAPASAEETDVFLELDWFAGSEKPPKPKWLDRWFEKAGFKVRGDRDKNSDELLESLCVSMATVEELLLETASPDKAGDEWYVHGLVLPQDCITLWDKAAGIYQHYSYDGLLWPLTFDTGEPGRREAFLILDGNFGDDEDGQNHRTYVFAHELAHVLNLHHCELRKDGWETYDSDLGEWSLLHFSQKGTNPGEVMPGGDAWCEISDWHRTNIHDKLGCGDDCGESSGAAYDSPKMVTLTINKDKERYFPGEMIWVTLSLRADPQLADKLYYARGSLDPASPYLSFSVGKTDSTMAPLRRPVLGYRRPDLVELRPDEEVPSDRIDVWVTLPRHWIDWRQGVDKDKPLWIRASYTLFEPVDPTKPCTGRDMSNCRSVRVDAEPVKLVVGVRDSEKHLFNEKAHAAFTSPEARRYLWLGGGEHLKAGKAALDQLAGAQRPSFFTPYAGAGLGLGILSRKQALQDLDLEGALKFLQKAQQEKDILPPRHLKFIGERVDAVKKKKPPVPPRPVNP